jgi:hypothetical protein
MLTRKQLWRRATNKKKYTIDKYLMERKEFVFVPLDSIKNKKQKHVTFSNIVNIMLIPNRIELNNLNCNN